MHAPYDGGCLCGEVRYRVDAEPLTVYACHCTDCQRQSGASFALAMIVLRTALALQRGAPRTYAVTMPDGRHKQGRFCGSCSTRVWGEPRRYPEIAVLRPGTLDDASWLQPIGHIWTRSAQPWIEIPDDTVNFEGQPADPMALINAWSERSR